MRYVIGVLFCLFAFSANAAVIDIIDIGNGLFDIISDGVPYGNGMSHAAAQKLAQKLAGQGNVINWKSAMQSVSTPVYNQVSLPGGATTAPKALPAHNSNLPATITKTGGNVPATITQTGGNVPATIKGGGGGGNVTPSNPEPTPTPKPEPAPTPKSGVNAAGVAMGAIAVVSGAVGLNDSVKSKNTKATFGDVLNGAMSGASVSAGAAMIVNAIPVGGQIAYGGAIAIGAVIGASGASAKMFSETDCDMDPVTGQYACCNVSKLTNIQARYCNIGDEMFADFPYVRTCMQGKNKFESKWFKARFLDDHWSKDGEVKFCAGYEMPEQGDFNIQRYGNGEADGKVCWSWECADAGFHRVGGRCVRDGAAPADNSQNTAGGNVNMLPDDVSPAPQLHAGDPCPADRLPQYATAGKYIKNGRNEQTGLDKFVCAATQCMSGTYLVKNERGQSQGWCRAGTPPVSNDVETAATTENAEKPSAGDDNVSTDDATSHIVVISTNVQQNNCEMGVDGYVLHNSKCITMLEYQEIQRAAAAEKIRISSQNIANAVSGITDIMSSLEQSVWKNADGKFNTARLVSDSVAGVVLGTTGGIVTSTVMKKHQVEDGFENLNCVINGQVVAGYGDEFRVGIQ